MNELSGQELMSYSNASLTAGGTSCWTDHYYHYYPQWFPYYTYISEKSKVEQAFKIVGNLLEKNIIEKELTVKQFMKLVNEIAEII